LGVHTLVPSSSKAKEARRGRPNKLQQYTTVVEQNRSPARLDEASDVMTQVKKQYAIVLTVEYVLNLVAHYKG